MSPSDNGVDLDEPAVQVHSANVEGNVVQGIAGGGYSTENTVEQPQLVRVSGEREADRSTGLWCIGHRKSGYKERMRLVSAEVAIS